MLKSIPVGLTASALALLLSAPLSTQDPGTQSSGTRTPTAVQTTQPIFTNPALDGEVHGIPGATAGTERWIVHFKTRSFDLAKFRAAIYDRRPAAEVAAVVRDLEDRVIEDQRAFTEKVEAGPGADVVAQWWLINACAIEVPFKNLDKVRALPNVDRLEPDRAWLPWILKATDSRNHNSDHVQNVLKIDGSGVAVAVLDTGQNSDVGSGRPHRTYFIKGDPSNKSGSGIGGSRLVTNRQIGRLTANDSLGHGTGVGSIAAGAHWGVSGADHGHAFGANVAGYAIANSTRGGASSSSTMVSAWQAAAADRSRFNIVSANLSYGGSPNVTEAAQQALDSAALNADIMISVAAGNSASSTAGSQSAANGLAVAAIAADSHTVASFSSRGPLFTSGRFYPDLAACGVNTVMAQTRNENRNLVGSGTSMASPQVCGVAALVRAANKNLTALQTKAILLASLQNISSANSSLNRNAYGLGMLRADLAVQLALAGRGVATGTVDSSNRTARITLNVTQGRQYAVAVTWHRTVLSSSSYSNLDIRVLDGSSVIGQSNTPLNLYEQVSFLARKTGTLTLEVSSPSLTVGSQAFAWAFTEAPRSPIAGIAASFGQGCQGSGIGAGGVCQSDNTNRNFRLSTGFPGVTYALEIVASSNHNIDAWEMLTASGTTGTQVVQTRLYSANSSGQPASILATGSMSIGASVGWYKSTFNQRAKVQQGQKFFLAFVNASPFTTRLGITTSGNITPYWRNNGGGGSWVRFTTRPWAWRLLCAATGPGAVPAHGVTGEPTLGGSITLTLRQALASAPSILMLGSSNSKGFGTTLPFNLAGLGAPNCSLLVSGDVLLPVPVDASGNVNLQATVPNDKTTIGLSLFTQFAVQDQKANNLGFAFSNAMSLLIGGLP